MCLVYHAEYQRRLKDGGHEEALAPDAGAEDALPGGVSMDVPALLGAAPTLAQTSNHCIDWGDASPPVVMNFDDCYTCLGFSVAARIALRRATLHASATDM